MRKRRVTFPGAHGDELAARVERPIDGPRAWALLAHCFTCSKDLKALGRIGRALVEEGIGVMRFDFTGLGESGGDFADTNFSSNLDDLVAAAEYMAEELGGPDLLVGHSLGGAAVLGAAHRIAPARAVVTIGAPSEPSHLLRTLDDVAGEIRERGEAEVSIAGRRFTIKEQLLEDLEEQRLRKRITDLGLPLLVLHSPTDETVGIDHARKIYEAAKHPKSFVSLAGADHLLLENPRDGEFVGTLLAAWASRYVCEGEAASPRPVQGEVWVEGGREGYTNVVRAGRHRLLADEPEDVGGADLGPGPYDYLLAALGTCTSMTLRMYADRKEWPLECVRVVLRHERIHAEDCEECESTEGMISRLERRLHVTGDLDEEQRSRLGEIAEKCPVHKTLAHEISIRTVVDEPDG